MSKGPFQFSAYAWQGRVDFGESFHASPCTDFSLPASGDYRSRHSRGPVFVLLGFSAAAAMDVERHGPAAGPLVAVARAVQAKVRGRKRLVVERSGASHFSVSSC